MDKTINGNQQLEKLETLLSSATQTASRAMTQWTSGNVLLSMDRLVEVSLDEATQFTDMDEELMTMVVFNIEGTLTGQLLLTFDDENGRVLANSLIGKKIDQSDVEWSPLERSAIMETGNILASAYLNELTRIAYEKLTPSAPNFIQDFGASVLGQAILTQAMFSDRILICRTRFEFDSRQVNWNVYFLPSLELVTRLKESYT